MIIFICMAINRVIQVRHGLADIAAHTTIVIGLIVHWLRCHISRRSRRWAQVWSVINQVALDWIVRPLVVLTIPINGTLA